MGAFWRGVERFIEDGVDEFVWCFGEVWLVEGFKGCIGVF